MKPAAPVILTINGGSSSIKFALFEAGDGHILINSGFERTVPLIQKSVESLGFKMTLSQ